MTDPGGAASPRTDPCSCAWPGCQGQCHTGETCPCHPAAQEAPAPAGWLVPATAKGTAIGTDEWGRRLYVHVTDEPHPLSGAVVAQEAPAPEGLRAALEATKREWIDCEANASHNIDYRAMARALRAEARPPEGRDR